MSNKKTSIFFYGGNYDNRRGKRKILYSHKILKEYESMELCKTVKRVMGEWHYDDEDIKRLSMIMTLYETDFSKEDIDEYMQLILSGENDEECLKILSQKRKKSA